MFRFFRSHISTKIFISYLLVILVVVVVLATATSLVIPTAFNRHMAGMSAMMAGKGMINDEKHDRDVLFTNYRAAVVEAFTLAGAAALIAALLASYFISRQLVTPIQKLMKMSHRIAEGEYSERLAISGDIQHNQLDEVDQLALSFNQMADKLEKTEMMRRQLIGDVSHELRTPLTGIKGYMEGLIDGVIPADPETYQLVYKEADRLQRLVNDLQELSRVESGAYPLNLSATAPKDMLDHVYEHLTRQFEAKGLQFETDCPENLPEVMADPDRLQQVLTNLAGNALQYTPEGGKVTLSARQEKEEIVFSVKDNGIGIEAEQLPLIFNRFYRADRSRARKDGSGGSGIGLTIAQALVKAHGGRIWVESAGAGKGSTFFFTIPLSIQDKKL